MLFQFKMREVVDCELQTTEVGKRCPSWFYMTDSDYHVDLGEVKLFESSLEYLEKYSNEPKYFNYQYARFLEDLFHELPRLSCPIPTDLYAYINTDDKRCLLHNRLLDLDWWDKEKSIEMQSAIEDNVFESLISYGYFIQMPPSISGQIFHVADEIILRYDVSGHDEDGTVWWTATSGEYRLSYKAFLGEVEDLLQRFFTRMDKQVENVLKNFTSNEVKCSNIVAEHEERRKQFHDVLNNVKQGAYENLVDWEKVREDLTYIMENSK